MDPIVIFDEKEKDLQHGLDHFNNAFLFFRYEGTAFKLKNAQSLRKATTHIARILENHRKLQEQITFPFLDAHFPKHEAVIHLLRRDHVSLSKTIQTLQELLKKFEKTPANIRGETAIHKLGIHIACLLRYHIALERKSIRSAKRELKRGEKRELADRIARVLKLLL